METYYIRTFGCQMNDHDSFKMAQILTSLGIRPVSDMEMADLILFNTCTVRDKAQQKAHSDIGRAAVIKRRIPTTTIGVCGCVAQQEKDEIFRHFPAVDIVFGPDQIHQLPDLIQKRRRLAVDLIDDPGQYVFVNHEKITDAAQLSPSAHVKIIKGCNNTCSFCIVPSVRGKEVSRDPDDVVREVMALSARGVREVTLLGQNVNAYEWISNQQGAVRFTDLVCRISSETTIDRIRYTSPHPRDYDDALIDLHATDSKLCQSVHMPLQSGSSTVLARMKRSYNKAQYLKKSMKLRDRVPNIELSTDIIVGFPGETDAEFQETIEVIREVGFEGVYAFKYSPRPGTVAAAMIDDVRPDIKDARLEEVLTVAKEVWESKKDKYVGTIQQVLVEGESKLGGQLTGRTFGNRIVNFEGAVSLVGQIIPVKITRAGAFSIHGEVSQPESIQ